jgi:hypothetical protein
VFLEETGVNSALARPDARAPQGARVPTAKPLNQGKHMTVLGARSRTGLMAAMTVAGSTDAPVC